MIQAVQPSKFGPIMMSLDLLTCFLGYQISSPTDPILSKFGGVLSVFDISQGVQDEILKIAAGIVLSAFSRVLVAYSETWAKNIKERMTKRQTKKSK